MFPKAGLKLSFNIQKDRYGIPKAALHGLNMRKGHLMAIWPPGAQKEPPGEWAGREPVCSAVRERAVLLEARYMDFGRGFRETAHATGGSGRAFYCRDLMFDRLGFNFWKLFSLLCIFVLPVPRSLQGASLLSSNSHQSGIAHILRALLTGTGNIPFAQAG